MRNSEFLSCFSDSTVTEIPYDGSRVERPCGIEVYDLSEFAGTVGLRREGEVGLYSPCHSDGLFLHRSLAVVIGHGQLYGIGSSCSIFMFRRFFLGLGIVTEAPHIGGSTLGSVGEFDGKTVSLISEISLKGSLGSAALIVSSLLGVVLAALVFGFLAAESHERNGRKNSHEFQDLFHNNWNLSVCVIVRLK